jgi:hypothetical protein
VKNHDGIDIKMSDEKRQAILRRKTLNVMVAKIIDGIQFCLSKDSAREIISLIPDFFKEGFWAKWKAMVMDDTIEWDVVREIRPLPDITEAYDITAPDFYTMVTESGIVVQDTMSFHVPVSDKAVRQTKEKMLPSKNLFKTADLRSVMPKPIHEMSMGAYLASSATPKSKTVQRFRTIEQAMGAYRTGKLGLGDLVEIG